MNAAPVPLPLSHTERELLRDGLPTVGDGEVVAGEEEENLSRHLIWRRRRLPHKRLLYYLPSIPRRIQNANFFYQKPNSYRRKRNENIDFKSKNEQ